MNYWKSPNRINVDNELPSNTKAEYFLDKYSPPQEFVLLRVNVLSISISMGKLNTINSVQIILSHNNI
jgi:hypothetical protein